ncbi:hypothetical protein ACHAXM_008404 [Skeletonema potamos]
MPEAPARLPESPLIKQRNRGSRSLRCEKKLEEEAAEGKRHRQTLIWNWYDFYPSYGQSYLSPG